MTEEQKQENEQISTGVSPETENDVFDPDKASKEDWLTLIAQKDEEIKQMQDRIMRIAAEADNTRKRLERERTEGICFANEKLIQGMLPVLDNLERAVQHGENNTNVESLLEGVRMTLKGFGDTLAKFGCVPFDSVGKAFDPNYHEAVMQQESPEHPENTVLQELEKGYTLNDRLLRPAKVVVSKAPVSPPLEESAEESLESSEASDNEQTSLESGNSRKIKISVETNE
jgi:molecular chaperone GrpE